MKTRRVATCRSPSRSPDPATDDDRVGAGVEGSAVLIEFALTFGDEDVHLVVFERDLGRRHRGGHGGNRRVAVFGSEQSSDPGVEWFDQHVFAHDHVAWVFDPVGRAYCCGKRQR